VTKLPRVSGRKVVAALGKLGYQLDRQKGSHMILRLAHPPHRRLTVPDHREISAGTLRAIIRQAGLTVDEFASLL
jgi:predicted RNA binding protein YcfA (HicA-like mRNA interferase family)